MPRRIDQSVASIGWPARPLWFCPEDKMKVWWASRVDPAARYGRLVEFAEEHGLVDEMRFWHRRWPH